MFIKILKLSQCSFYKFKSKKGHKLVPLLYFSIIPTHEYWNILACFSLPSDHFSWYFFLIKKKKEEEIGFPGGSVVGSLPAGMRDTGLVPSPEDSSSHEAAKPMYHNYRACALEPMRCSYWAQCPACALQQEKPPPKGSQHTHN